MNKSLFATTVLVVALLSSSSAFAVDKTPSTTQLTAFQGIQSTAASAVELEIVGQGFIGIRPLPFPFPRYCWGWCPPKPPRYILF
jgi:hypothetical protein